MIINLLLPVVVFVGLYFVGDWAAVGIGVAVYLALSAWMLHRRRTGRWPFSGTYVPGRHDPLTDASDRLKQRDE